jgi:hypothetical protein
MGEKMRDGFIVQCEGRKGLNGAMVMAKDRRTKGKPWRLYFGTTVTLFGTRRRARVLMLRTIKLVPEFEGKLFIKRVEKG